MSKSAIILGATGLTGSLVLQQLIANPNYDKIKLFSRKPCKVDSPKIEEHIVDVLNLESVKTDFTADEVYVCIGTTKKKTPDKELYRKIDLGIPTKAANLAKVNGINTIVVVSAIGANAQSSIEYNRIKGDMEEAVLNAGVERTFILRPSIIAGNRNEKRAGERFGIAVFKILRPLFFGKLKKYRAVEAEDIARKMIQLASSNAMSSIIESDAI